MESIPVYFKFEESVHLGYFSAVSGSGAHIFHLTVDGYHWGQLWKTEHYGWQFGNTKGILKDHADYFAEVVTTWGERIQYIALFSRIVTGEVA